MSNQGGKNQTKMKIIYALIIVAVIVAVMLILNVATGGKLLGLKNMKNVLAGSVVPALVAYGFLFIFTGDITDLSPGGVVLLAATATGIIGNTCGIPLMILGGIAVGVFCITLNFVIYRVTKIPPWIAGLGMLMVYEAIGSFYASYRASSGQKVVVLDDSIRSLGQQPWIYVCWIVAIAAAYFIYNHTSIGVNYRSVGNNGEVSKIMGINLDKTIILGGVIAGAFLGFAGVVKESYAGYVNLQSGLSSLTTAFQPMAAALLAMALSTFLNVTLAVPIAAWLIVMIFNALTLLGVPSGTFQDFLLGVIVIVFAVLANRKSRGVVK